MSKRKNKPKRNYKAEYRRRIERAAQLGYSRAVARGHARKPKRGKKGHGPEIGLRASKMLAGTVQLAGKDLRDITREDKRRTFGRIVKPEPGETGAGAPLFQLRLEEEFRREGKFSWLDERRFIREMQTIDPSLSVQEAYTLWFS